ncbi:DUF4811 domain-containing protein [Leuconostocaceae bacterium ESL0958]|nr:DUF4811 domain-containing protein [Leuconostocaceae bacterium ESL0958]
MIIFLIFIFLVLTFISWMLISKGSLRYPLTLIFAALTVVSIAGVIANMHEHYGMEVQTKTTKKEIYSAQGQNNYGILSYQQIGTSGKEKVYVYRASADAQKPVTAKPDLQTSTKIENIDGNKAYQVTKAQRYVYKNNFYKFMFGIAGNNYDLKHRDVSYQLPANWLAMSVQDGMKLQSLVKEKMQDPDFASQLQASKQMAAEDPDEAGRQTVALYKQLLGQ